MLQSLFSTYFNESNIKVFSQEEIEVPYSHLPDVHSKLWFMTWIARETQFSLANPEVYEHFVKRTLDEVLAAFDSFSRDKKILACSLLW